MKKIDSVFLSLMLMFAQAHATEYIYPVFSLENQIYCIHQKTLENINLIEYNTATGTKQSALLTYFNPVNVTLLPEKNGISFIDNGVLKIKHFGKRSPRSIEIAEPLYNIRSVFWVNDQYGYINAQYSKRFGIFILDYEGIIKNIIFDDASDFFHPQKSGNAIFFINKSCNHTANSYRVLKLKFDHSIEAAEKSIQFEGNLSAKKINGLQNEYCTEIVDFGVRPIAFLVMSSEREGFVIEHPSTVVNSNDTVVEFKYHRIYEKDENWHTDYLFTFSIPISFLFFNTDNQLHESLFPLIPKKINEYIYYSSCDGIYKNLNIYRFNSTSGNIEKITNACAPELHYFCPLEAGGKVYCGASLPARRNGDEELFVPIELPAI